jgi:hypothetical protein
MDGCGGVQGRVAVMRQARAGDRGQPGRAPSSPGYRGHPPRSLLERAKRGNPVGVRASLRDGRSADRKESSIPRRAQDDQEANAGRRKAAGNHRSRASASSWSSRITGRIPGQVPGRESELTWSGEPRKEKSTMTPRTNGQVRRRDRGRGERTRGRPAADRADRRAPDRPTFLVLLEPDALKGARPVLRGATASQGAGPPSDLDR